MTDSLNMYVLCPDCRRHVREQHLSCPFCGASVPHERVTPVRGKSSVLLALTATMAGISLTDTSAGSTLERSSSRSHDAHGHEAMLAQGRVTVPAYGIAPPREVPPPVTATARVTNVVVTGTSSSPYNRVLQAATGMLQACLLRVSPSPVQDSHNWNVSVSVTFTRGSALAATPVITNNPGGPSVSAAQWDIKRTCIGLVLTQRVRWPRANRDVQVQFRVVTLPIAGP